MGKETAIAWTDHTFNPLWGCVKVAPECAGCYAEAFDRRTGGAHWGATSPRRTFGDKHWAEPLKWDAAARAAGKRARVFCGSMCDVFEDHPAWEHTREHLWETISHTPHLDWLLLTKRPEGIVANLPAFWGDGWDNVWLGTSVGHPDSAFRAQALAAVPAAIRFLSCEPLIGPVIFPREVIARFQWLIAGGESGARRRPMDVEWMRALHGQARAHGLAFFAKQDSAPRPGARGAIPDDLWIREFPPSPRSSRTGGGG